MIIKSPPIYDVSHWKEIPDFSVVSPRPELMITKATEGTWLKDEKFIRFFEGMAQVGFQRGAFHFNRKAADAVRQAKYFCDFIRPHITQRDYLALDVEEGGERASQLWAWFEYVRGQFPNNPLLLYGRKDLLDPVPMTESEKAYFKRIPLWVAGYPTFPDLHTAIPRGYIPDQTKWGPVWLWQYSAHGRVGGIVGDVDLNLATPEFLPILFSNPTPEPQPEPEEDMTTYQLTVLVGLNIRAGAGTNYEITVPSGLRAGDKVESLERVQTSDGSWWYRIATITRSGLSVPTTGNGWASAGATGGYMRLDAVIEPTPSPLPALQVTVSGDGYESVVVELRPK